MGNYYEVLGKMQNGDVISSDFSTDITKKGGVFYYSNGSEVLYGWGKDGVVVYHGDQERYNWQLVSKYVEIDLNEVAERLAEGKPVYIDDEKEEISGLTSVSKNDNFDYEDTFILSHYYKKHNE